MRDRSTVWFIGVWIVVGVGMAIAILLSNNQETTEGDVAPSTRQFTKPESERGEWVREPKCPEGSQEFGTTVENDPESDFFLRTSAVFGEDGRDMRILLTAEHGNITMIYEIDWVPGAAEGNPEAGSSEWSLWRHVPDSPHGQVWLENPRGFTAGDYLQVCIDRGDP